MKLYILPYLWARGTLSLSQHPERVPAQRYSSYRTPDNSVAAAEIVKNLRRVTFIT